MKDLTTVSTDLFNKVRSRFSNVKMGAEDGTLTTDPETARFFDVSYKIRGDELGRVNLQIDDDALTVIYDESMLDDHGDDVKNEWFDFLKELRQFARKNLLKFDTRDIAKSNLEKRDYAYLAQRNGEEKMSESKLFGTSKTSYQDVGEAKIIVKHSAPVNYANPAGRTQRIESIYIESSSGERFRYPAKHLNGARAMAVHVANGGNPYDGIGNHISGLSEELSKLRQFKNYTQRSSVMAEAMGDISERVMERIEAVKHEVASLQKQAHYESFRESFAPTEAQIVPEDMINSWVDALTIRTFNEELKGVFPYIYKLVSEKRDGELSYEDLVAEEDEKKKDDVVDEEVKEHSMFQEFEDQIDEIGELNHEKDSEDDVPFDGPYSKDSGDVTDKSGAVHTGQSRARHLARQAIPKEVVEFIQSMYDGQTGTFPRGEEGVKIACEKKFGEQAGQFAHYVVEKLSAKTQGMATPTMQEAAPVNFDKVLDAIAALHGDDMWDNDSMQDLAHDLEQQNPTDQELDFIIANGTLPQRLAGTEFTNNDNVKFGENAVDSLARIKELAKY